MRLVRLFLYALSVFILAALVSCSRDGNFKEGKRVHITVIDGDGKVVEGATVSIYKEQAALRNNETPVLPAQKTDKNGKTTFYINDADTYFLVNAETETLNNWYRKNELYVENQFENKQTVVVENSLRAMLCGKKSKSWLQKSFYFDGKKLESCLYRRVFEFNYDGIITIYEAEGCGSGTVGANVWQLIESDTKIRWGVPNGRDDKLIETLTDTDLILSYKYGGQIPSRETFVAVE